MNDDLPINNEPEDGGDPSQIEAEILIDEIWSVRKGMWQSGFRPVPVYGHDQPISEWVKAPGKQPAGGRGWHEHAKENPPRAVAKRPQSDALNTGILANGLRPLDLDIEDSSIVATVRSKIEERLGSAPVRLRRNSPKITMLYRAADGEPPKLTLTGAVHSRQVSMKVEVLGRNGQFVAHGIHPTGAALEWENDKAPGSGVTLDELPIVTEEQISMILDEIAPLIGAQRPTEKSTRHQNTSDHAEQDTEQDHDHTADAADVAAALAVIPNDGPADWTFWKHVGMATYGATAGRDEGFDAWALWSAKNDAHDHQACERAWEEMRRSPPSRIGAGTLFKMAQDAVPGWRAPSWGVRQSTQSSGGTKTEGMRLPPGFEMTPSGLFYRDKTKGGDDTPEPVWVAAPFEVLGMCQNGTGGEWGKVLRWTDKASIMHEQIVLQRMLPGKSSDEQIAAMLENGGLQCSAAPALLRRFLLAVNADRILKTVETTGWHSIEGGGWVYVMADGTTYGHESHDVILRPDLRRFGPETEENGTLEDWKKHVARYAVGNSRLAFFLAAAFAGPLIAIAAEPSGGLHMIGKSRSGKSTILSIGASAWGRSDMRVRQWRATANGLEGIAKAASDSVLFLDEIGQAEGRDAGDTIYMLANGMSKQRATTTGAAREIQTWNLLFLTTGEVGLEAKMAEGHRTAATGLHVRLVNIDADAGAGLGVFQTLHDKATPAELADYLRVVSRTYYGVASRRFLQDVVKTRSEDPEMLKNIIESFRDQFRMTYVPEDADGQVVSVAARFSLIAAAGEIATVFGILPWKDGEALRAAGECFNVWLNARGHAGAGEDEQAIAVVRRFIVAHGQTRFSKFGEADDLMIRDRVGWRKKNSDGGEDYLFQADQWSSIFNGSSINHNRAAEVLDRRGLLANKTERNRLTARPTIAGDRPRVYWVSGRILSDEEDDAVRP